MYRQCSPCELKKGSFAILLRNCYGQILEDMLDEKVTVTIQLRRLIRAIWLQTRRLVPLYIVICTCIAIVLGTYYIYFF
jgi:hypothetical protein